jgi:O-antigen/teichoic acid export membrane protein
MNSLNEIAGVKTDASISPTASKHKIPGSGHRIAKNASVLMGSQLITWGLAIALTIFLPRMLGVAAVGRFQLASSLWAIVTILVTFGMDTLLTKEIARSPDKVNSLFSTSVILRAIFFVFGFIAILLYTWIVGYPFDTVLIILIIGVANLFIQFAGACQATLQGLERMEYVSLSDIISKAFITLVTIALLFAGFGVYMAAIVLVFGALLGFLIQFLALKRLHTIHIHFDWSIAKWMLRTSYPYLLIVGVRTAYIQIDVVILSLLATDVALGWYSAASRLYATFLFIPTVLMMAFFPVMSRSHANDPRTMLNIVRKNFDLMLILGVPIGFGLFVLARPLVVLLFGPEFAGSGPVLAIMGIVLIATYENVLIGNYLISTDRQNILTSVIAVATLATLPLDLIFIPYFQSRFNNGAIGGASSFLVTEVGMLLCGLWLLPKGTLHLSNAWLAARVLFTGAVMAVASWQFRNTFILLPILVGALTYLGLILILRVIPKEDWQFLKSAVQIILTRIHKVKSEPSNAGGEL